MASNRRILDDALYAHFVTFNVFRRRRLLDHDHPKKILLGVLNAELRQFEARCVGFVIMPDHVHLVVWFAQTGQLSRFMQALKRKSSFHIRNWQREHMSHYFREFSEGDHLWQPKYHSFEIYEQDKLREKLNYMHNNPCRRGLVQQATDWKWSSARWYDGNQSVGVPIRWVE